MKCDAKIIIPTNRESVQKISLWVVFFCFVFFYHIVQLLHIMK